jgi:hypothetical protein
MLREQFLSSLFYKTYEEYLRHPVFLAARQAAMNIAKGKCERCNLNSASEVHHLKYPPWGTFDVPSNLMPVCHRCHCEIEGKER